MNSWSRLYVRLKRDTLFRCLSHCLLIRYLTDRCQSGNVSMSSYSAWLWYRLKLSLSCYRHILHTLSCYCCYGFHCRTSVVHGFKLVLKSTGIGMLKTHHFQTRLLRRWHTPPDGRRLWIGGSVPHHFLPSTLLCQHSESLSRVREKRCHYRYSLRGQTRVQACWLTSQVLLPFA